MKAFFIKSKNGWLRPYDDETRKYVRNRKPGQIVSAEIKQSRNYEFHKKMFSLFNLIHDALPEPEPIEFMGELVTPEHTLDATRKYLTVKAGYYDVIGYPNGSVRVEAKSLAYDSMSPEEFEKCYSAVIDAALKALPKDWSEEKLNRIANQIINYV